jgi:hypothetical protein
MVYETFHGEEEEYSGGRCVIRGELIDQVILENRCGTKRKKEI